MVGQGETGGPETEKRAGGYRQTETHRAKKIKLQKKPHYRIFHKTASKDRPKLVGIYSTKGDFAIIF